MPKRLRKYPENRHNYRFFVRKYLIPGSKTGTPYRFLSFYHRLPGEHWRAEEKDTAIELFSPIRSR
jgi:hypothetical protein